MSAFEKASSNVIDEDDYTLSSHKLREKIVKYSNLDKERKRKSDARRPLYFQVRLITSAKRDA